MASEAGRVWLVGAGPGDPGLLTLRGRQVLARAEVVLYDNLVSGDVLEFSPLTAERIYVGKKKADHSLSQPEIGALLVAKAKEGKRVVRLKGGDPLVFGRSGEELAALEEAAVPYELVPGITTAQGIASYVGVPLTHREDSSSVLLLTGHEPEAVDWQMAARAETLVVYMGLSHAAELAKRLQDHGLPGETPAMAVRWATRGDQQVVEAPLAELAEAVAEAGMKPPATLVIGNVVRYRRRFNWFERMPLHGETVLVTRAEGQSGAFREQLREWGARVEEIPMIAVEPIAGSAEQERAMAELGSFGWVLLTSANAVQQFVETMARYGKDWRSVRAKICAIGPATAEAVAQMRIRVDLMPEEYTAEGLVAAFTGQAVAGERVLLPRAAVAREVAPEALRAMGATVETVPVYRTKVPESSRARLEKLEACDWVTFTSSSTVKHFLALGGRRLLEQGAKTASIGPVTSQTLAQHGLTVTVEAARATTGELAQAILRFSQSKPKEAQGD